MGKSIDIELAQLRPKVLALTRRFFSSAHLSSDPEDIVQDVLLNIWKAKRSGTEIKNAEAWAVKATKNACISAWRKSRKDIEAKAFRPKSQDSGRLSEADRLHVADTASSYIEEREYQKRARKILESFSAGTRKLLKMKAEGMSLDEISAATGRSKGSVKASISTARRQMLEALRK